MVFGKESQVLKVSFYAFLGQNFFLKILRLNPKGKVRFGTIFQVQNFLFKVDVRHHPSILGDDLRSKEHV